MNKPPKDNKDKKNEEKYEDDDDIISPLQGALTGNMINLDGNPFTAF